MFEFAKPCHTQRIFRAFGIRGCAIGVRDDCDASIAHDFQCVDRAGHGQCFASPAFFPRIPDDWIKILTLLRHVAHCADVPQQRFVGIKYRCQWL